MSKVPNDKEVNTALTTTVSNIMSMIPAATDIDDGFKAPSSGNYLPFLEMVFPIMVNPDNPCYKGHDYKIGFKNGDKFCPLPAGTVLTLIDKRNSVRIKSKGDDNQIKNSYGYAAIERNGQKYDKSAAIYNEMAPKDRTDANVNAGYSTVVVALLPDGTATVLDFSAYATMTGYMYPALSPALLTSKIGLRIDIEDHTPNLVKSKSSGFFYPDAKKFKQWQHVQLTKEQLTKAVEAINLNAEAYMNWLNR